MVHVGELDDEALVDAAARRDHDALAELYRRHASAVYRYAVARLGQRHLAEDVVQDVFVRLWRRPDGFDAARGSVRTYLITLAYGRSIDVIRSESARRRREQRDRPTAEPDLAGDAGRTDEVRAALDALTDDQREAITLAYYLGYSYRQVAELLEVPEGTIKNRIRTGLARLRGELTERADVAMSRRPDDVHDLLAAYALGALDDDDRAFVEGLVVAEGDARVELDGYRAGVALLDVDDAPRPEVWDRIEAAIGDDRRPGVVPILTAPSRRRGRAVVATAAAALLAVTLWGAGQLHNPSPTTEAAAALHQIVQQAAATPGVRHLTVTSPDASSMVRVIVLPDGRGFVVGGVLAHAGTPTTYALYATTAGKPVLVAVLGSTLHLVAFQLPRDAVGLAIGVTSGVDQPVQDLATQAIAACPACPSQAPAAGGGASPGAGASPSPSSPPPPSQPSPPPPAQDAPASGASNPLLPPLSLPTLPVLPPLHQLLPPLDQLLP